MKQSYVIGRVAKSKEGKPRIYIDQNKGGAAVALYCGTQYNKDDSAPKVHLTVTAWFNFATDKVKALVADDVVMITGTLSNNKNKEGVHELSIQAQDNNLTRLDQMSQANWGVYTNFVEMGYISGVFQNGKGYKVNIRTRYYQPYYKKNPSGTFDKVNAYDERQVSYSVGPSSIAYRSINAFLSKTNNVDIGDNLASPEQLEALKNFYVVIEDGFTKFDDKKVGDNRTSLFANNYVNRISFIFKHVKAGDSNNAQSSQSKVVGAGNIPPTPPTEAYDNDEPPFPELGDGEGYNQEVNFP